MVDTPLVDGLQTASYSGAVQTYVAEVDGVLVLKLWGGGGGGGVSANNFTGYYGGGGGFTTLTVDLLAGDIVKVEVGGAGAKAPNNTTGGAGAWPDGGDGAANNAGGFLYAGGGGGGSTRVYINDILYAVAGAGGGGCLNDGGAGGGSSGLSSVAHANGGVGGSQSAAGLGGGSLQGADSGTGSFAGGGGGGGYYGGGRHTAPDGYRSGGGGSGFVEDGFGGSTTAGALGTPAGTADSDYPGSIGHGGASGRSNAAEIADGEPGSVVMAWTGEEDPGLASRPFDPEGQELLTFTGEAQELEIEQDGTITFKLWGAGGGGGISPNNILDQRAGGGGFVSASFQVVVGDVVKVEVGGGGARSPSATSTASGGWPDGGDGGYGSASGFQYAGGGGGGSTRIYLNDVLIAIAGAGGGGCISMGGAGGGTSGQQADAATRPGGTGGTQSAGGSVGGGSLQGADSPTGGSANAGGGGGGGYYGGGYANSGSGFRSGGGGSGYLDDALTGTLTAGSDGTPAATGDSNYPGSNIGQGGITGRSTLGLNTAGEPGFAYLQFEIAEAAVLEDGETTLSYSGLMEEFVAEAGGRLTAKLWGAGGGGGRYQNGAPDGGGGGFTEVEIIVNPGDLVKFEVGQGGRRGENTAGGMGGWPDGGDGSWSSLYCKSGGGGGSTRIWIDRGSGYELVGVAGGGGGSSGRTGDYGPGAGGGGDGQDAVQTFGAGTGGDQSTGGINTSASGDTGYHGGYLQGGRGFPTAVATSLIDTLDGGGGGGGGYYGGGGGGRSGGYFTSGGGGSGFVDDDAEGSTTAGALNVPAGTGDTNYPGSNIGYGGDSQITTAEHGNNGAAWFDFQPGAFGELGTITLTAPNAVATTTSEGSGDIGTVTMTSPAAGVLVGDHPATGGFEDVELIFTQTIAGSATGEGGATGLIPEIAMVMDLGGQGTVQAIVVVPMPEDEITLDMQAVDPGDITGAVNLTPELPGPITLSPPQFFVLGEAEGEPLDPITLTAPEALAEEGVIASAEWNSTITLTASEGAAAGEGTGQPYDAVQGAWGFLVLSAPQATGGSGPADAEGEIGTITLTPIEGFAEEGVDAFATFTSTLTWTSDLAAVAGGGGTGVGSIGTLDLVPPPTVAFSAGANITVPIAPPTITLSAPDGITQFSVSLFVSILPARVTLRAPRAVATEGEGVAVAIGDMDPVYLTLSAPEGISYIQPAAQTQTLTFSEVDGYVEVAVDGFAPLRYHRSITPGAVPTLTDGEIAFNEHDGVLYARNDDGEVVGTPYLALHQGGYAPAGGAEGQILGSDRTWQASNPTYDREIRLPPPESARIVLSEGSGTAATATPAVGKAYLRPFFLPKRTQIADLVLEVTAGAAATAHIAISNGETLFQGSVSVATTGEKTISADITLDAGWYDAVFALAGAAGAQFAVMAAPLGLNRLFEPVGDLSAPFAGDFDVVAEPTAREATSWAFISAETP